MLLVKNGPFFHPFFFGNKGRENVFYDILERRNVFLSYKNKKFKKWKNCHFSTGVSPMFWSKIGHFSLVFFKGSIFQENVFYDILERKNLFLGYKNKKFEKWKNWHFSKGVSLWFWSKIGVFSIFFFKSNIGQENVFYDILERKNAFLGYKIKNFKKWKNSYFFFVHAFGQKLTIFSSSFFGQHRPGKCVFRYSTAKKRVSKL